MDAPDDERRRRLLLPALIGAAVVSLAAGGLWGRLADRTDVMPRLEAVVAGCDALDGGSLLPRTRTATVDIVSDDSGAPWLTGSRTREGCTLTTPGGSIAVLAQSLGSAPAQGYESAFMAANGLSAGDGTAGRLPADSNDGEHPMVAARSTYRVWPDAAVGHLTCKYRDEPGLHTFGLQVRVTGSPLGDAAHRSAAVRQVLTAFTESLKNVTLCQ